MNAIKYFFKEKARGCQSNKTPHGCVLANTGIRKRSSGIFITVFINVFERICKCHRYIFKVTHLLLIKH